MLVKIKNAIININEIKYMQYDKKGYKYYVSNLASSMPLLSIYFSKSEKLEFVFKSINEVLEYSDLEYVALKNNFIKLKNITINCKKIKYIECKQADLVKIVFSDDEVLDIELKSTSDIQEYEKFEKTILENQ